MSRLYPLRYTGPLGASLLLSQNSKSDVIPKIDDEFWFLHPFSRISAGERGGSVVKHGTLDQSERLGVQNLPQPCCVLEQDTLFLESTGNTCRKW